MIRDVRFNPTVMMVGLIFAIGGVILALIGDSKVAAVGAMTSGVGGAIMMISVNWPQPMKDAVASLPVPKWLDLASAKRDPASTEDEAMPNPAYARKPYERNLAEALDTLPAAKKREKRIIIEPEGPATPESLSEPIPEAQDASCEEGKGKVRPKRKR